MAEDLIDYGRSRIKAAGFVGPVSPDPVTNADVASDAAIAASKLQVAAGDDGLTAQSVQAAIQALWTEVFGGV